MPQRSNSNRSRSRSNSSGSSSNRNRSSDEPLMRQWGETAKDNPLKTAAVAAGAVAAGVFLWSKRNEISNQISQLSDQITDWAEGMQNGSGSGRDLELTAGPNESSAIESSRATGRSRSRSASSGGRANQTSGGRSQGQNSTF